MKLTSTIEQKKRGCWEEYCQTHPLCDTPVMRLNFNWTFDRAYALGKEKEAITQEDVEKASLKYILNRQQARHDVKREEEASLSDFDNTLKAWDAFDMAQAYEEGANFALGKQFGNSKQVDIEEAAEKHADEMSVPSNIPGALVPMLHDIAKSSYLQGAQDFIGKQEKDADTVISGWVARDKDSNLVIYSDKPKRVYDGEFSRWEGMCLDTISNSLFPDLKWESDPIEVELIIKRKKK